MNKTLELPTVTPMTVLIAPADCLRTMKEQPYYHASLAFDDSNPEHVLEVIRQQQPSVIALERTFVTSPRGHAFIKQVKSDPSLEACTIETVSVRRAPRHRIHETTALTHDGPVALLDVSTCGAQVRSSTSLKPRQRIRVSLQGGAPSLLGIVVWSHFELPKEGPCYRAGIEFVSSAIPMLAEYLAQLKP